MKNKILFTGTFFLLMSSSFAQTNTSKKNKTQQSQESIKTSSKTPVVETLDNANTETIKKKIVLSESQIKEEKFISLIKNNLTKITEIENAVGEKEKYISSEDKSTQSARIKDLETLKSTMLTDLLGKEGYDYYLNKYKNKK